MIFLDWLEVVATLLTILAAIVTILAVVLKLKPELIQNFPKLKLKSIGLFIKTWSYGVLLVLLVFLWTSLIRPDLIEKVISLPPVFHVFQDCDNCPKIVALPAGSFMMGSLTGEEGREDDEDPVHKVTINYPFAAGVYEVTYNEWDYCVQQGGCGKYRPDDAGWGPGDRPVINVSWNDAQAYVQWLSKETGKPYRLLSEAEWEYAARAGTTTPFHFGDTISTDQANYDGSSAYDSGKKGKYRKQTVHVGSFSANNFGLHDMHGNVWEWVEDCWHDNYINAPTDGSPWVVRGNCNKRVIRGGSWDRKPSSLRSANRGDYDSNGRNSTFGFRVARELIP